MEDVPCFQKHEMEKLEIIYLKILSHIYKVHWGIKEDKISYQRSPQRSLLTKKSMDFTQL